METMRWLAELGRPYIVSDVLYVGPTRQLVKDGDLIAFRDRAGQWCVSLPAEVPAAANDAEFEPPVYDPNEFMPDWNPQYLPIRFSKPRGAR